MKVLITGSAGFLGSHMVEHLLENTDWKLIGIDSFKHRGDSARIQKIKNDNVGRYEIFYHDLNAPITHRLASKIGNVDYVINTASESHVDRSIDDPVNFVRNNVNVILHMLEFARTQNFLKGFIQISTDEVFGAAEEGYSHKEWDRHLPSNPYSASKSCQEAIAISYWRTYGVPIIITNTMNLTGERQDPEKYISKLIKGVYNNEIITVHGSDEYIGKRHYLHARNLADACMFLINHSEKTPPTRYADSDHIIHPDRYNIAGRVELDNLELAQLVAEMMDRELNYELVDFHKTRPGHDRRYALDSSKIRELGWVEPVSFKDSLKKTIEWTLKNEEWLI